MCLVPTGTDYFYDSIFPSLIQTRTMRLHLPNFMRWGIQSSCQ